MEKYISNSIDETKKFRRLLGSKLKKVRYPKYEYQPYFEYLLLILNIFMILQ